MRVCGSCSQGAGETTHPDGGRANGDVGGCPLGERDKINMGMSFPLQLQQGTTFNAILPPVLGRNGSKSQFLHLWPNQQHLPDPFCKMPWMWQGRVEKMPTTPQLWGGCLNTRQTLGTSSRENKSREFTGGEAGLPWPRQLHNSINSRLAQGWFFSLSNSPRTCTLLWWIFCTITDYCHGNRCITWQLCYLRDKKQLLKETGVHQEWGYLFSFFFLLAS